MCPAVVQLLANSGTLVFFGVRDQRPRLVRKYLTAPPKNAYNYLFYFLQRHIYLSVHYFEKHLTQKLAAVFLIPALQVVQPVSDMENNGAPGLAANASLKRVKHWIFFWLVL